MRITWLLGLFLLVFGSFGCAKNSADSSEPKTEDATKTRNEAVQKLYARKDEFAAMKAPSKPQKGGSISPAFMMFKLPGLDWEVVGMEKDDNRGMTICDSDKCNNRNIFPVKNRLPKWVDDAKVNYLVRADCKEGKKLAELTPAGSLYESDCEVTVVNLFNTTTIASGRAVTKMPKEPYKGAGLDIRSYAAKGDKGYLVPIDAIDEFLNDLEK